MRQSVITIDSCSMPSGTATGPLGTSGHDVTLDEVREAILKRRYWSAPGGRHDTGYGQTYAGRYLLVVAVTGIRRSGLGASQIKVAGSGLSRRR
jgi:hypothetical protein